MISIIIPVKNEAEYILLLFKSLVKSLTQISNFELIFIDDSTDDSYDLLFKESLNYTNIIVKKGKLKGGYGAAIKYGFEIASGDYIIVFNSDLCNTTQDLLKLIKASKEGYDIVIGSRFMKGGRGDKSNLSKYYTSYIANRLLSFFLPYPCTDYTNSFKCYKKNLINQLNLKSEGFSFSLELALKAMEKANWITSIPVKQQERIFGSSKMPAYSTTKNYGMVAVMFLIYQFQKSLTGVFIK